MFDILRKDYAIINIMIILVAVSPAFALGDGNKNMLLIGAMCLSPYYFFHYPVIIPKVDIPLTLLCFMMITFPLIFHPETMRWSTVLYSCLFCMYFMAFARVLSVKEYTLSDFARLLKGLIYAYCIVLIIQQFCVLFKLPIFNVSNYSLREPWKLNSLMSEPSHSSRIIPILMYLFIICEEAILDEKISIKESFKKSKLVWLSFIWCVCTMGSATAFIFILIILAKFINIKKILSTIIMCSSVYIAMFYISDNKAVIRAKKIITATLTLDEDKIFKADGSGGSRVVPSIQAAKIVGITTESDLFGHGIDVDQKILKPLPGFTKGQSGSFFLWINYGIIVALIWWIFTLRICYISKNYVSILIWFLIPFSYGGFNNQIVWMTLIIIYTYKNIR